MLPGHSDGWYRPCVHAAAETHHVPGGSATGDVESGNQGFVVEGGHLPLLSRQDARTVDELEFAGRRRQAADANSHVIRLDPVLRDVLLDQRLVGEPRLPAVDGAVVPAVFPVPEN